MGKIKIVIGVCLIVISFIYLIKNPGQSMMNGLLKKQRVDQEKMQEYEAKKAAAKAAEEAQEASEANQE